MTRKARSYANLIIKEIEEHDLDPAKNPFPCSESYMEFLRLLKENFRDLMPERTAQHKLGLLTQGNRTADKYTLKFRTLAHQTRYNDAALVEKFEQGLNQELRKKIYNLPQMPVTSDDWIVWAMRLDRQWRMFERNKRNDGQQQPNNDGLRGQYPRQSQDGQRKDAALPAQMAKDPNAIDVD